MEVNRNSFADRKPLKSVKLKVSSNRRFLTTQDGQPFFYLGDTAWTFLKRLNHEDVDLYLQNRVAKGFTVIQCYLLRGLRGPNLYGHLPLKDKDPTKPNEPFFENVDYIVKRANDLGLVMGIVVCWGEHVRGGRSDEQIFNPSNAQVFGRFLGDRYKDNAIIWYLGGDRNPLDGKPIWSAMARGLKEGSGSNHLISYHGPGDWRNPSSSYWFHNEDWLDFNVIQSGHGWGIHNFDFVTHDYNLKPVKPTIDMEPRYENFPDVRTGTRKRMDAHQSREAMYWAMLAGAAGHGYGCNDIWQFYDEAVTPFWTGDEFTFPARFPTTNWRKAVDFAGAVGVGISRRLFEMRPWYQMVPDQSVVVAGQGTGEDHVQAARAVDGSFVIAYLTFGNPVTIDMTKVSASKARAQWYDPRDGSWQNIGEYPNTRTQKFAPPTQGEQNDWVLVLEDPGKNYPSNWQDDLNHHYNAYPFAGSQPIEISSQKVRLAYCTSEVCKTQWT